VEASLERANGGLSAELGAQRIALGDETLSARPALKAFEGRSVILGIRPEDLEDAALASDAPDDRRLRGKVELREALGAEIMVHFTVDARPALTDDVRELAQDAGDERAAQQEAGVSETTMVGRFGARSQIKEGESADVVVDTRALHFFDPETGTGIYEDETPTKGDR
ncbi:MAG: TOBE domain-containing protein, partial [Gaiellaceae bacterium]